MKSALIIATLVLVGIFVGLTTYQAQSSLRSNLQQPVPVSYVNVTRYLGAWYQQAVIPYYFERNCQKTVANYSLNHDGSIKVVNTCMRNGKLVNGTGKAVPEDSTNAKLKVQFVETLDIGAQYWIVRLGNTLNYEYAVVASPNYHYLWVLYREPKMPEQLYQSIIADLKKDNYPVEKLTRTQQ